MRKITLTQFLMLALVFTGLSTMAQTKFLVDFNYNIGATYQSSPNWNNWNAPIAVDATLPLVTDAGASSTLVLKLTSAYGGANEVGVATPVIGFNYPGTAMMDALYNSGTTPTTFELSGLDVNKIYNFEFFGSRKDVTNDRTTVYTCVGANTATASSNASGNANVLAVVNEIVPNAEGKIIISFVKGTTNAANFSYLNFFTATEMTPSVPQVLLDAEDGTFNKLTLNVMANGPGESNADYTVVDNPSPTGINTSTKVVQFRRNTAGDPWSGFWSPVVDPDPDFTTNKYVHVKVLKTRISPAKFKIQGGAAGDLEIASVNTQTQIGVWEDFVFDFSSKTGTYPTVVFMPDFLDPGENIGDIMIYFDDIVVNNIATPTMGIIDNYLDGKISIFPNPSNGLLTIESLEEIQSVSIFSLDGRQVANYNNMSVGITQINIENLSKGMYFVNFVAPNGATFTHKLIKE
jgi:hypothetical protein